jgi:putative YhbY family RNA-binding protein
MLTPPERKALKARAHKLEPVVQIGAKGLTPDVMAEIERALHAHELIKIRAAGLERDDRELALTEICTRTGAEAVQAIGKVFVIFRRRTEDGQDDD